MRKHLVVVFLIIAFFIQFFISSSIYAETEEERLNAIQQKIAELEKQLQQTREQEKTLKNQLTVIDTQTNLAELKIAQTIAQIDKLNKEVQDLSVRIIRLSATVDSMTNVLLHRIIQTYKYGNFSPVDLLFSSRGFSDLLLRTKYIQAAQSNDKRILYQLQATKATFNDQKIDREKRQVQQANLKKTLERYQDDLVVQKKAKEDLLNITKNKEANYQALLAQARAEFLAIQGIVAGQGKETEAGPVSLGQRIATIINGASCNSDGAHLHFMVVQNKNALNPFTYLKPVDYQNCSGSSCGSSDSDIFNPAGGWDWPINAPVKMNQGYGNTWAVNHTFVGNIYRFHNGIDIEGSSLEVKAVKSGTLFRGSYSGVAGCALPYVRVRHNDDGLDTLYLHVYY